MSGRLLRIGFDMDGVLANFVEGFLNLVNDECGTSHQPEEWLDYGGKDGPAFMGAEKWKKGWERVSKTTHFWAALRPYFDVDFDMLERQMEGMEFAGYFTTRRKDLQVEDACNDAAWLSKTWLIAQGINSHSGLVCTANGDRVTQLKTLEIDAYIDDWGEQFLKVSDAGIDAYLIDRPYNQEVKTEKRVKTVHEFVARALARYYQVPFAGGVTAPPSLGSLEHDAVVFSLSKANVTKIPEPSTLWGGGRGGFLVVPKEPSPSPSVMWDTIPNELR